MELILSLILCLSKYLEVPRHALKVFEILTRAVLYTYGSFQIEEDEFIIEHMDSKNGNYDLNFLKKHLSRPRYLIYERIKYHFQKKMPDTQCNVTNFSEQDNLTSFFAYLFMLVIILLFYKTSKKLFLLFTICQFFIPL